ncbi:hypothetical protein BDR03DRAFT_970501 [Suillus americanus]|nr:hypothetical protein BDR03DRAFT_970501 [Suillus americanus]
MSSLPSLLDDSSDCKRSNTTRCVYPPATMRPLFRSCTIPIPEASTRPRSLSGLMMVAALALRLYERFAPITFMSSRTLSPWAFS